MSGRPEPASLKADTACQINSRIFASFIICKVVITGFSAWRLEIPGGGSGRSRVFPCFFLIERKIDVSGIGYGVILC